MSAFFGELAALATSLCFSATSTQFTLAGRQVGATVVNRTRLVLAVILLTLAHLILGISLPILASAGRWLWLGISGVIGLVLGDAFLFQSFILIGPRLAMLLMSLAPIIASITAWIFLGEMLSAGQIFGILLTVAGIAWVVLERNGDQNRQNHDPNYLQGILFGLGGATGQALGLIFAKKGLYGDFPAISGTLIRMITATILLWGFTFLRGQARYTLRQLANHRRASLFILSGSFSGPFLGVTFSLIAIQLTEVGIASTLMALPPVILLPISYLVFGERFGWQAIVGTLLALVGVAVLFLV